MFSDKTTAITDVKTIPLLGGVKFAKIRLQRSARFDYFTPPSPFRQGHPSLYRNARGPHPFHERNFGYQPLGDTLAPHPRHPTRTFATPMLEMLQGVLLADIFAQSLNTRAQVCLLLTASWRRNSLMLSIFMMCNPSWEGQMGIVDTLLPFRRTMHVHAMLCNPRWEGQMGIVDNFLPYRIAAE